MVTLEECECAVYKYFNAEKEIAYYMVHPFGEDRLGYLGEYYRLIVFLKSGEQLNFFVKAVLEKPNRPEFVNLVSSKEFSFYKYIAEVIKERPDIDFSFLPEVYYVSNKVFIMEDLTLKGFKCGKVGDLNKDEICLGLKALSKFHATSWAHKENFEEDNKQLLEEANFSNNNNFAGNLCINNITKGISKLLEVQNRSPIFIKFFSSIVEETLNIINKPNKYKKVCCHGDLWSNNLLFNSTDCKIVDYQLLRYAPPAHDVTTLIFHNSNQDLIKKNLFFFYDFYYKCLEEELNKNKLKMIPIEEFEETCRIYMKVAKVTKILYCGFQAANIKRSFSKENKALDVIMDENDSSFIVEIVAKDEVLRETIDNALNDLESTLLNPVIIKEDCFGISYKSNCRFKDFVLKKSVKKINLSEEYYYLNIIVDEGEDLKYIVKSNMGCSDFNREVKFHTSLYNKFVENEINLIKEIIPKCVLAVPNHVIVRENLLLENYEHLSNRKPFTLDEVKAVIEAMTKLHASCYILEENISKKNSTIYRLNQDFSEVDFHVNYKIPQEHSKMLPENFEPQILRRINKTSKIRSTVCHANLNQSNILFNIKEDQINIKLLNFNSYIYAPPTYDLMTLLHFTTTKSFRKYFMEILQSFYYSELSKNLKSYGIFIESIFSFEDFLQQCELDEISATVRASCFHQESLLEERLCVVEGKEINIKRLGEDRCGVVGSMCEIDPVYKERQDEVFYELKELAKMIKL